MGRHLSPRYGQVILVSGYLVLTAVNWSMDIIHDWSQHWCAISFLWSWAMRNPKLQKKPLIQPVIRNVGSQLLNQLSTKIRPKKNYKTYRKDLHGCSIDIHKIVGNLPKPKAGFTPENYKYMGPYNPLDQQLTKLERLIYDAPDKQTHLITSNVNRLWSDSNPFQNYL